jgi:peptidoglycan/xylan/chitin deacetylase (PgdA/CDA1 family)
MSVAKKALKLALLPLASLGTQKECGLYVLIYHRVGANMEQEMDLPTSRFAAQMAHLKEHREVVKLSQGLERLASGVPWQRDAVAVTFDDGYADVAVNAFPILEQLGIPATIFLPTAFMEGEIEAPIRAGAATRGRRPEAMTWADVERMRTSGLIDIGSHSHTHRDFNNLTAKQASEECERSRDIIAQRTGTSPEVFAYPRAVVAHDGVVAGYYRFAVGAQGLKATTSRLFAMRVPRIPVRETDGMYFFKRRLAGMRPLEDNLYARMRGSAQP